MSTNNKIESLHQERQQLLALIYQKNQHPKMKLVIRELRQAVSKIEDKLIQLTPSYLDRDINDARCAPIEYTKRKPTDFDRRQLTKLYKHRRFVCVRQQSDFHYPKNMK